MIDKQYGKYHLICEICGEEAEECFDSFGEVVEYKKYNGWISQKTEGRWQEICPSCKRSKHL